MSVIKRGDRWYVTFRYRHPATGCSTRFRRTTGIGTTKREALELEAAWRLEVLQPPRPAKKSAAFSGFARQWFDVHVMTNLKPASQQTYRSALAAHLVPAFGDRDLRLLTREDVEEFKARLLANGAAPGAVNTPLKVLSALLTDAVCWGYCESNPAAGVRHLAVTDMAQHWTREEASAFLDAVTPRWRALFATALMTGLRRGELAALEWSDIDLDGRRIDVRRNWSAGQLGTPKSGKSRTVPIPSRLVRELRAHPHRLGTDLVFPAEEGGRPSAGLLLRALDRGAASSGVPRIRFHDLRHTYASHLVMAGVPLKAVQEYLGHASITTTMRYAHLSPGAHASYIEVLSSVPDLSPDGIHGSNQAFD